MSERDQVVNQLVFAASALRSLDLGVIGDLLGSAYDAGAAAECGRSSCGRRDPSPPPPVPEVDVEAVVRRIETDRDLYTGYIVFGPAVIRAALRAAVQAGLDATVREGKEP